MAKKPIMNLKRKTIPVQKLLTDSELAEAIAAVTKLYMNEDFRTVAPKLDNDYRVIFENSKYEYKGFSSDLGIFGDIRLHFVPKEGK